MRPKCPRDDCDLTLIVDQFYPPGAWTCKKHGGPIFFEEEIKLVTEARYSGFGNRPPVDLRTEQEALCSWLMRLAQAGLLRYSISKDMAGTQSTHVTIENHGPEEIDIRFEFDPCTGKLVDVKSYADKR